MFKRLKTIEHYTVLIDTLLSSRKPYFCSRLWYVHLYRVRGETDQLSTNTGKFKYRASVYIAAQQYLHYFNGGSIVSLSC